MASMVISAGALNLIAGIVSVIAVALANEALRTREWPVFWLATGGGVSGVIALALSVGGWVELWQEFGDGLAPVLAAIGVVLVGLAALFDVLGWYQSSRPAAGKVSNEDRARAIGNAGETLVAHELARLGYPALHNVILCGRGWMIEIDHLVRLPDGIVVLETKTWSGLITGERQTARWMQHRSDGERSEAFLNPVIQNGAHVRSLERFIGDRDVAVRGYVVSAGSARFAPEIAAHVVPLGALSEVLRSVCARSVSGVGRVDAAWQRLRREEARSGARRRSQISYARRRRRSADGFSWFGF